MLVLVGVLSVLLAPPIQSAPVKVLPRVFVTTEISDEDGARRHRLVSVKDLRDAFADRKKSVRVVDDLKDADIVVDVVERTTTVPKFRIGLGSGGPGGTPGLARSVRLRVKAARGDNDPVTFINKSTFFENDRGWTGAADDVAKQIEKWIQTKK